MCMFISISCLRLSHFVGISSAHSFPCTTECEDHQECIAVIKVVLITIHTHHLRSCTRDTESGCSPPPLPSAPALFTLTFCLLQNSFWTGGINPGHHHYKQRIRFALYDVSWMNAGSNRTYISVHTPKKNDATERQILLEAWPSSFRGHIIVVAERESNTTCLVWGCEKLALWKSYGQNKTQQLKIKILFLTYVYEHLLHRLLQHQPWVEITPCQAFCVNFPMSCSLTMKWKPYSKKES